MSLDIDQIKEIDSKLECAIKKLSESRFHISSRYDSEEFLRSIEEAKSIISEIDSIVTK